MKNSFIYKMVIVLFMIIVGVFAYDRMPDIVPIHWGFDGTPDKMGSKMTLLSLFPILSLVLLILFPLLQKIDPRKQNYEKFEKTWEIFQIAILLMFAYMYLVTIYASMHQDVNMGKFMLLGVGSLFMVLGNYMGKIRQNYFVGIKLPWTIDNEQVWNKTHRFGGKVFMFVGFAFILNSYFFWNVSLFFIISIGLLLVLPIGYSYYIYSKLRSE